MYVVGIPTISTLVPGRRARGGGRSLGIPTAEEAILNSRRTCTARQPAYVNEDKLIKRAGHPNFSFFSFA